MRVHEIVREPDDIAGGDPAGDEVSGSDAMVYLPESFLERFGDRTDVINTIYRFDLKGGAAAADEFAGGRASYPTATRSSSSTHRHPHGRASGRLTPKRSGSACARPPWGWWDSSPSVKAWGVSCVDASDGEALRALGMTDSQRVGVAVLRGVLVGVGAAVLAVAGAVAGRR